MDGDEAVLKTALADVIRAKGVAAVARKAGINRVTVYKTLKPGTESSFTTMHALLKACNVSLQVLPTEPRSATRARWTAVLIDTNLVACRRNRVNPVPVTNH